MNMDFREKEYCYTFSALPSEQVHFSEKSAKAMKDVLSALPTEYPYSDLYELEEVKKRLDFDVSVERHAHSAYNAEGGFDGESLAQIVQKNSEEYLKTKPFGCEALSEDYIRQICDFIARVAGEMRKKYPDPDWDRISCNLGNLKIVYDVGSLNFAQVSSDMVLGINQNSTDIVLTLKGEDGFSRVLAHETMHILQMGCSCEPIGAGNRRAGIAMYWNDFTLNTTDWTWMAEGSAERNTCKLTGGDAVTYQYKMDYLCSLTYSILLRPSVQADTLDLLYFYSDPQLFFDAFGAESPEERDELLNMMITLQILQIQPRAFYAYYEEKTGVDLSEDEEARDQFSYALKPAVCITLAKEFYGNLSDYLVKNRISRNDLFFLMCLFEGHLNQHLNYKNESKAEINKPFFETYNKLRSEFFRLLARDNASADFSALYGEYEITAAGKEKLNAELSGLPEEKRKFLIERAQWQGDLSALGEKVPN